MATHTAWDSRRHAYVEWGFVVVMIALCAGLTALQFRWTGEVGRAEITRLKSNLDDQAQLLCRAFDAEIAESAEILLPDASEIEQLGRESAHAKQYHEWLAIDPRPMFARISVAVPDRGSVQWLEFEPKNLTLNAASWPVEWSALRENLLRKSGGPPGRGSPGMEPPMRREPPSRPDQSRTDSSRNMGRVGPDGPGGFMFSDPTGRILEMPIFSQNRSRGGPPELEWLLLELDTNYIRNTWLPALVEKYFGSEGRLLTDVTVKLVSSPNTTVFSSSSDASSSAEKVVSVIFNPQLHFGQPRQGRSRDGRWVLEARYRPGALDRLVAESRRRNLGLGVCLNALVLVAGVALLRYTRRSRQLADAQMNFVAAVSHELRTPLTVIRGAGHNLSRGIAKEPAQVREYSQLIIQHADQLKEMVEQVLALAGARKGSAVHARNLVSIGDVIANAVSATAEETAACAVDVKLPHDLPCVRGDAAGLQRVFQNLISNAARHGASGKWIGVTASIVDAATPQVEVRVADRGPGVPAAERDEIFRPFVRGAEAVSNAIRGSGLGLSVVREIVEAHGGTVALDESTQTGATFVVLLPVANETA